MMIIDEHTGVDADAGEASARALQSSVPRAIRSAARDRDVATASQLYSGLRAWLGHRGYAVSIETEYVSLNGIASHEAAIAKIERHLHGLHDAKAPADPLVHRQTEF
jgi:transposase-like protein